MRALSHLPAPLVGTASDAARWREVTKLLAWHVHNLRDLLQLSQDQLARCAGVSQGAISRMEAGRCTDTPLVTYARVAAAFCRELAPLRDQVTPDVRAVLDAVDGLLTTGSQRRALNLFADPTLRELIRVYARLPDADRASYAALVETLGQWMLTRIEGD